MLQLRRTRLGGGTLVGHGDSSRVVHVGAHLVTDPCLDADAGGGQPADVWCVLLRGRDPAPAAAACTRKVSLEVIGHTAVHMPAVQERACQALKGDLCTHNNRIPDCNPVLVSVCSFPSCNGPFRQCLIAAPRCYCLVSRYPFFTLHLQVGISPSWFVCIAPD